ncbi:MAG: VOC family protein [Actinomycetota bacterium]
MTTTRLRQIVLAARELEPVAAQLEDVLGVRDGFNDPGVAAFGLKNVVYAVGASFVEVVVPVEENTAAGRTIDRQGEGGYMAIFQVTDIAGVRERVADLGLRVVWHAELEDIQAMHLHPKDIGGAIVSIDEPIPYESWRWGGPTWIGHDTPGVVGGVREMTVRVSDAAGISSKWAEVLGEPVTADHTIVLDGGSQTVRFIDVGPGEREGVSAFVLALEGAEPQKVEIAGATFETVPA